MSATGEAGAASSGEAGVTLIEALAVVAITGLVASIGFPVMQTSFQALARRQTVAVVEASLRQTRAEAMRLDRPVEFLVTAGGRRYGASVGLPGETPAGVRLTAAGVREGRIAFFGDGSSTGGVVRIRAGRRAQDITVDPFTGAIALGPS